MIEGLPLYVPVTFLVTTLVTIWFLLASAKQSIRDSLPYKLLTFAIPLWLLATGFLSTTGFYREVTLPPRVFAFGVLPALLLIVSYFIFFRGSFVERLSLKYLTLLHTIRIPVEIVLFWLFVAGQVPRLMTFEGWNFDILSGVTAPIVYFAVFRSCGVNRPLLIIWNLLALGLLANIVTIAVLSFPGPLQQFAFDQPNVGVTYLPFIWLPAVVVPIVLFAHLASLWQLIVRRA